jgi:hypothetical protein
MRVALFEFNDKHLLGQRDESKLLFQQLFNPDAVNRHERGKLGLQASLLQVWRDILDGQRAA